MGCPTQCVVESAEVDLNMPSVPGCGSCLIFDGDGAGASSKDSGPSDLRKRKCRDEGYGISGLYEDSPDSKGVAVKALGHVLRVRSTIRDRGPNVICKVELFGKIVGSFDQKCIGWVIEMGFGGMLSLVNLKLPRSLCYWLMTRIDPENERLVVGGLSFRFSSNQARWVLALPKGGTPVPCSFESEEECRKISDLERKYEQVWSSVDSRSGKVVMRRGLAVTPAVIQRLQSKFEDDEIEEFKMLFLLVALDMVLCPTQSSRFPKELMPALGCTSSSRKFNWCSLVLERLMASAKRFADRFYSDGYAGGCGGCTLFLVIFYLDRLKRNGVMWGNRPRIKAWTNVEIKKACKADRPNNEGDFGHVGVIGVAYVEEHPLDARDVDCSSGDDGDESGV